VIEILLESKGQLLTEQSEARRLEAWAEWIHRSNGEERRKDLATENPPKVKITHVNAHEGDNVHIIGAIKGH
jgi:hypothetical protein